jgi:hypothetical protein
MAKEDAVRKEETKAITDSAEERVKQNEADEENRKAVDAAREQMRAVLDGGLQLNQEKGQSDLRDAFDKIQKEMKEKFSTRLNTKGQNDDLAILMQGKRIHETFEIVPENKLTIKFHSINTDESSFIDQVSLLNALALRNGTENIPQYDNNLRTELTLAFIVEAINTDVYSHIGIEDLYETVESQDEKEAKVATIGDKITELRKRRGVLRQRLALGTYPTVITAMAAWLEYQRDLVSPMRIGNFSTPPSEPS